jgi:predicted TIM-barrel fold metal-dependent hydrolase
LLSWIKGSERLVYSSDYPHWDADEVKHISGLLPPDWHHKVFFRNAMELYGWAEADLPSQATIAA